MGRGLASNSDGFTRPRARIYTVLTRRVRVVERIILYVSVEIEVIFYSTRRNIMVAKELHQMPHNSNVCFGRWRGRAILVSERWTRDGHK